MINNITAEQAVKKFAKKQSELGYIFEALHDYTDQNGNVLYKRFRFKHPNGQKHIRPMFKDEVGMWKLGEPSYLKNVIKPLYGLHLLSEYKNATVVIVEGEFPTDKLNNFFRSIDAIDEFIAITSGSATSYGGVDWQPTYGRKCIIWPDNDKPGLTYADQVFFILKQIHCSIEIIDSALLNLGDGTDCVDWIAINSEWQLEDFLSLPKIDYSSKEHKLDDSGKNSQATDIIDFILNLFDLFHDNNKEVYASDKDTNETWPTQSRNFKDLITAKYYAQYGKSIRDQAMREALSTIGGIGRYSKECKIVNKRVARYKDSYFLDLSQSGNSKAVKISRNGWEIIASPPVIFIRSNTMQMLPEPVENGDFSIFWQVCNIPVQTQLLVLTWLIETLRPDTPYPVLEIIGEQGSAKSTTQTMLRRLIDPNSCDLRGAPKQVDDLFIAAGTNHLVSYENISHLSSQMQDALCVVATGGGHAKRKLFSDADEEVIHSFNPVMINGISASITAQDLIDRAIGIELPVITTRMDVTAIKEEFAYSHAIMLGGLLDIFSKALQLLPNIRLPDNHNPRLFEFAKLGVAISKVTGNTDDEFLQQFSLARQESITRTIDASPVASAIMDWFENIQRTSRTLSTKDLFAAVERHRQDTDAWPKTTKGFADSLRRASPALRQIGIACKCLGKQGSYVMWSISPREPG